MGSSTFNSRTNSQNPQRARSSSQVAFRRPLQNASCQTRQHWTTDQQKSRALDDVGQDPHLPPPDHCRQQSASRRDLRVGDAVPLTRGKASILSSCQGCIRVHRIYLLMRMALPRTLAARPSCAAMPSTILRLVCASHLQRNGTVSCPLSCLTAAQAPLCALIHGGTASLLHLSDAGAGLLEDGFPPRLLFPIPRLPGSPLLDGAPGDAFWSIKATTR